MLDDLTKEIKAQLYERVKSPLFGAFAFSWVAWNYRALLAVLSKMSFQEKIGYFDTLYPTFWHWLGYCLAGPLLVAVLFLLAYPHPARWMYRYWANQHKELKKVQQSIEDETPLTQEEARALRKASIAQISELESQITDLRQLNRELNERLRESAVEQSRLTNERDQFQEAAKAADEQLTASRERVMSPAASHFAKENMRSAGGLIATLPDDLRNQLDTHFPLEHETERDIFLLLIAAGGEAYKEAMADYLDLNIIDVRQAVILLTRLSLVNSLDSGEVVLSSSGLSLARELNLTKVLPKVVL